MDWIPFDIVDFIDIVLFGLLLYALYRTLRSSSSTNLLFGIVALVVAWVVASPLLHMRVMGRVMDAVMGAGLLVLIILFQDDIRRFLNMLGSGNRWFSFLKFFQGKDKWQSDTEEASFIAVLTFACTSMAKKKTGALIVLEGKMSLEGVMHTGERIDAEVNSRLIENIFFKNSPLHDGAMIISKHRIAAAGCILPVAQDSSLPKEMGLRHRSGLGMSEQSDARIIIVSEERGEISVAYKNEIVADIDSEQLQTFLSSSFKSMSEVGTVVNKAAHKID